MTPAGTSSSLKRDTVVGISHTSQCVNVPPGASGSVTSSARLRAVVGTLLKSSSGETAVPLQVYFCGIAPLLAKAGLVRVIGPAGAAGSGTLPGGASFRFGFMHEAANVRVRTRASGMRIVRSLRAGSYNRAMPTFFDAMNDLMAAEVPLVVVTVVDTMGSVPQDRGARMIVTADGLRLGAVGGGKVETKAIAEAQKMLRGERAETTSFAQWSLAKDVGMTC